MTPRVGAAAAAARRLPAPPFPVPPHAPYFRRYEHPVSRAAVTVVSTYGTYGEHSTPRNLRPGDVYAIHVPATDTAPGARKA